MELRRCSKTLRRSLTPSSEKQEAGAGNLIHLTEMLPSLPIYRGRGRLCLMRLQTAHGCSDPFHVTVSKWQNVKEFPKFQGYIYLDCLEIPLGTLTLKNISFNMIKHKGKGKQKVSANKSSRNLTPLQSNEEMRPFKVSFKW